jgi:uncharacterized protein YheU (UPF0270 family)
MQDERELTVELERERGGGEIAPIRVAPDDLKRDTLRAVIESFVLREGTDYGVHETSLEDKVAQVLLQLRRGEAHITFDPATESINVVVTNAISGSGRVTPAVNDLWGIEPDAN